MTGMQGGIPLPFLFGDFLNQNPPMLSTDRRVPTSLRASMSSTSENGDRNGDSEDCNAEDDDEEN